MMAELKTDFNVAPFYDDYDEDKQYYRMLFRPATAVQARELTQLQTMMQKQISRFGSSIYKDGSKVEGCNFTEYPKMPQIKFKDKSATTLDFSLVIKNNTDVANVQSHLTNSYLLVSNTTGLRAAIFDAYVGAESVVNQGSADTNRAYVIYLNSGNNAGQQVSTFNTSSEQVDVYNPNQDKIGPLVASNREGILYTLSSNSTVNALGVGYGLHMGEGIIYQKGFFLKTLADNFVIKEHSSSVAGLRVGFDTAEYIVKPAEDDSLYDNSIGSSNQNAPGAYRLKLVPSLVVYDSANTEVDIPKDFLPIIDYDKGFGVPVSSTVDPQYSLIGDQIALRTKEESGDYIVRPFQVSVENSANSQTFYYNVSPGTAYVDGYRVNYDIAQKTEVQRAIYSESVNNNIVTANFGHYLKIREVIGTFDIGSVPDVGLYSANQFAISQNGGGLTAAVGTSSLVGNANVRAIMFNSGTKGTASAEYLLYISNIRMKADKNFEKDAKSIHIASGTYGKVYADIYQEGGRSAVFEGASKQLIFDTGLKGIKNLLSNTNINSTSYIYRTTSAAATLTRTSSIQADASITISEDRYNYGVGSINDVPSEDINVMFNADAISNLYSVSTGFTTPTVGRGTFGANSSIITCTAATGAAGSFINNYGDTNGQNPKVGEMVRLNLTGSQSYGYHHVVSTVQGGTPGTVMQVSPAITLATQKAVTGVQITSTAGAFQCTSTALTTAMRIRITGTYGGTGSITGYSSGNIYKISATNGTTTFTLADSNGGAIVTAVGTPTGLTYEVVATDGTIELFKFHPKGSHVNFNGSGNVIQFSAGGDGFVRSMDIQLAIDLRDPATAGGGSGTNGSLIAQTPIIKSGANPIEKVVSKDTYVAINCASHPATTQGPWSLGLPDVYKISSVYVGAAFANTNPDRKDWFVLDNGQTDAYYGLSQLKILPRYQPEITSASRLLVRLNHFTPNADSSKTMFFSKDSYPINDDNPTGAGVIATAEIPLYRSADDTFYDLRNYIDFRPVMANTANSSAQTLSTLTNVTINPANNQSVYYTSAAAKVALEPDSSFTFNAQYYLPRSDALLITREKQLIVKSGAPSNNPKPPILNNSGLKIADIYVPPYPSLTFQEAE